MWERHAINQDLDTAPREVEFSKAVTAQITVLVIYNVHEEEDKPTIQARNRPNRAGRGSLPHPVMLIFSAPLIGQTKRILITYESLLHVVQLQTRRCHMYQSPGLERHDHVR